MQERPLLLPLLALIAGVSAAASFAVYIPHLIAVPLFVLAIATLFLRSRVPFWVVLSLLFLIWGNISVQGKLKPQFPPNHIIHFAGDEEVIVEGVLDSRPHRADAGCRLQIVAEKVCLREGHFPVTGKLLLFVGEGMSSQVSGDRVRFRSRLNRPRNHLLPGAFDYERHLALQDTYAVASVNTAQEVILIRQGVTRKAAGALDRIAAQAGSFIDSVAPPAEAAVLRALLLGEQGAVSPEVSDRYARSGVSHILSISGFHMGILALVLFQALYRLISRVPFFLLHCNVRRLLLLLTLPVIVFYLFLSGAAPATVRSVIMLGAFVIALALERKNDTLDSLVLAAVVILLLSPADLYDISFQLSFLALWGLLVLTPCFMAPFQRLENRLLRKLLLFFMASAAATVATAVPVAFYFHRLSFTGLLANFLVVPLLGYGAVVIGFLSLPLMAVIPTLAEYLVTVAAFLVWMSNLIIALFARIPVTTFLQPTWVSLAMFFLFVISFTFIRGKWLRSACCGVPLVLLGVSLSAFIDCSDTLRIDFFSVGQGEATLLRFPNGQSMLIDGGGTPSWGSTGRRTRSVGERLLAPALWSLGVKRIDYLVLTHPHPDHLQGLPYIAREFAVGEMWEGDAGCEAEDYRELKRILVAKGVPVHKRLSGGEPEKIGDAVITFPLLRGTSLPEQDLNERSLVFKVTFGAFSALFTGDVGAAAEEQLIAGGGDLGCTVLKVPHHGSRTSSSKEFLAATSPREAVMSVGYRNPFHLPARETVERLSRTGARIWRTDEHGTITITAKADGAWHVAPYAAQMH